MSRFVVIMVTTATLAVTGLAVYWFVPRTVDVRFCGVFGGSESRPYYVIIHSPEHLNHWRDHLIQNVYEGDAPVTLSVVGDLLDTCDVLISWNVRVRTMTWSPYMNSVDDECGYADRVTMRIEGDSVPGYTFLYAVEKGKFRHRCG